MIINIIFQLTFILVLGLLIASICNRFRISSVPLLIICGFLLGLTGLKMGYSFRLPVFFLKPIIILAIAALVFSLFERLRHYSFNTHAKEAMMYSVPLCLVLIIVLGGVYYYFSGSLTGMLILPFLIMPVFLRNHFRPEKNHRKKWKDLIKNESLFILPLCSIIPVIIAGFAADLNLWLDKGLWVVPAYILISLSAGIVAALVFLRFMRIANQKVLPVMVFGIALLAYLAGSSMISGLGVLAVASFAAIFSNTHIKRKVAVRYFFTQFLDSLSIILIVFLGIFTVFYITYHIFLLSLLFFMLLILLRFTILIFTKHNIKEKFLMSIYSPKGTAVGVVCMSVLCLSGYDLAKPVVIAVLVMLYSDITAILTELIARCK
ncbi:MAG: cation:proton antiporter [Nanobdellota archaeon]